jgi:hypothetical protein
MLTLTLRPTHACARAGNRLRVAVSDSAFPLLLPYADPETMPITAIDLSVPLLAETGVPTAVPVPEQPCTAAGPEPAEKRPAVVYSLTRDLLEDRVEILFRTTSRGETDTTSVELSATAAPTRRSDSLIQATLVRELHDEKGEHLEVRTSERLTDAEIAVSGELAINGATVFSQTWHTPWAHSSNADT